MSVFVHTYERVLVPAFCSTIIGRFTASHLKRPGRTGAGVEPQHKRSSDLTINGKQEWSDVQAHLVQAIEPPLIAYLQRFSSLLVGALAPSLATSNGRHAIERSTVEKDGALAGALMRAYYHLGPMTIQQYERNKGGYTHWHSEVYPTERPDSSPFRRVLFWLLYLNDVESGGETEFLYQDIKIEPKAGQLVIAPAGFTHTHRGNVPTSNDKFIITSWLLFRPTLPR